LVLVEQKLIHILGRKGNDLEGNSDGLTTRKRNRQRETRGIELGFQQLVLVSQSIHPTQILVFIFVHYVPMYFPVKLTLPHRYNSIKYDVRNTLLKSI
jgi:hypothetical protein